MSEALARRFGEAWQLRRQRSRAVGIEESRARRGDAKRAVIVPPRYSHGTGLKGVRIPKRPLRVNTFGLECISGEISLCALHRGYIIWQKKEPGKCFSAKINFLTSPPQKREISSACLLYALRLTSLPFSLWSCYSTLYFANNKSHC